MYRRRQPVGNVNTPFKPLVPKAGPPVSGSADSLHKVTSSTSKKRPTTDRVPIAQKRVDSKATRNDENLMNNAPKHSSKKHTPLSSGAEREIIVAAEPVPLNCSESHFRVLWRKKTTKKNKTWDGDGVLVLESSGFTLRNSDNKVLAKSRNNDPDLNEILRIGPYEVEIEVKIDSHEIKPRTLALPEAPKLINTQVTDRSRASTLWKPVRGAAPQYDPTAPGAVVMTRMEHPDALNVVIDPILSEKLRPHQREGVKFLYDCVMGLKANKGRGALLADEMGLGKTFVIIALLWTLLKQPTLSGHPPPVKRALIVCPVTLIKNWKREFKKWLGTERIGVLVADSQTNISHFMSVNVYQVLIIGYEKLRTISADLQMVKFDIVVCDEGHRLKTAANKSAQAILSLNCAMKIILSGTPIQNDLSEFFVMIDFLNPGCLGTYAGFKKAFELPIIKSRDPAATASDIERGTAKSSELMKLTKPFVLRRTASQSLLTLLPPKTMSVIYCKPTDHQKELYQAILQSSSTIRACFGSQDTAEHLKAITMLKKLCTSPALLSAEDLVGTNVAVRSAKSGKLEVLEKFLQCLFLNTTEKVIIVSGYTQTLDLISKILGSLNMPIVRLDGSTPSSKRQAIVDRFNNTSSSEIFAFLLSAKSGGTGLNLIGASRLFLVDTDWNPSVDLQAMARVHRDGQTRQVFIYRLLTSGSMDEKIFQRQVTKQGLADSFMDEREPNSLSDTSSNSFTLEDLQDLFSLQDTNCNTHDLLECTCNGLGLPESQSESTNETLTLAKDQSDSSQNDESIDENRFVASQVSTLKPNSSPDKDLIGHSQNLNPPSSNQLTGWTTAKEVQKIPSVKQKLKLKGIKGLLEYRHLDVTKLIQNDMLSEVNDPELEAVIGLTTSITMVFTKCTRPQDTA